MINGLIEILNPKTLMMQPEVIDAYYKNLKKKRLHKKCNRPEEDRHRECLLMERNEIEK